MRAFNKKTAQAALGLSVALLAGSAWAAIPAPLVGTYLTYTFNTDPGIFGTASLDGDDLVFTPTADFKAMSVGELPGFKQKTLTVTVSVNEAYANTMALSVFNLTEEGRYSLDGNDAIARATGSLSALDVEGNTGKSEFASLMVSGLGTNGAETGWDGNAGIALPGGWGGADGVVTRVELTISNQLTAIGGLNGTADIWKEVVRMHVVTSPVPEAETYAMMLAGLGLVGFMVRRNRRALA